MTPSQFVTQLSALRFTATFNPYAESCPVHDLDGAPDIRADILAQMLDAASRIDVDAIWVGRDLGYRGGRRTGMALTDDVHFHRHLERWDIKRARPTVGRAVSERTATVVWDILDRIQAPIFLWNVFPLHPHNPADPFTNRPHNAEERRAGIDILEQLIRLVRPKRLIAIGNDAGSALQTIALDRKVLKVRHPSYGGQTEFNQQMHKLYDLSGGNLL